MVMVLFLITSLGKLCLTNSRINSLHHDNLEDAYNTDGQVVFNRDGDNSPKSLNNNSEKLNELQTLKSQLYLDPKSSTKIVQANCTVINKDDRCRAGQFEALLNLADRSLCRCEERSIITQVDKCLKELQLEEEIAQIKEKQAQEMRELEEAEVQSRLATIFAITPTYARTSQKVDLTSLCQTVMNVPNFVWIVIEDSFEKTPLVTNLLERCKVESVHLNVRTPLKMRPKPGQEKNPSLYSRGVEQRNAGLSWIRNHCGKEECRGVVYFMDDDNKYDLRLFEEMRKTEGVSVFPVGFSGGLKFEGPLCVNGAAAKWHVAWDPDRPFPLDMAGFAVNVQKILDHPSVRVGFDENGKPTKRGYLETSFLENFATRKTAECRGVTNEILVWHVKTQRPLIVYEGKHPSDPLYEI